MMLTKTRLERVIFPELHPPVLYTTTGCLTPAFRGEIPKSRIVCPVPLARIDGTGYVSEITNAYLVRYDSTGILSPAYTGKSEFEAIPDLALRNVYKFLAADDIMRCQSLNDHWHDVGNNTLVFEGKIWTPSRHDKSYTSMEKLLENSPFITKVNLPEYINNGDCLFIVLDQEKIINMIIQYQKNIKYFKSVCISYRSLKNLTDKFQGLETLDVKVQCKNIQSVLECLASLPVLKELKINFLYSSCFSIQHSHEIVNIMIHNFKSLEVLDARSLQVTFTYDDLKVVLEHKCPQLKSLCINIGITMREDIIELLEQYKHLNLYLHSTGNGELVMSQFKNHRSLHFNLNLETTLKFEHILFLTFFVHTQMDNVESIKVRLPKRRQNKTPVVENIIAWFPNVKIIDVANILDPDIDSQLLNLNSLTKLKCLALENVTDLKRIGWEHISLCSLKVLCLSFMTLDEVSIQSIINCLELKQIEVNHCRISVSNVKLLLSSTKKLKVFKFRYLKTVKMGRYFDIGFINEIQELCTSKNITFVNENRFYMRNMSE